MKFFKSTFVVFVFLVLTSEIAIAQGPPPPPGLPIDGGLGFLAIGGILYGVYKSLKRK